MYVIILCILAILRWFVEPEIADAALNGWFITEEKVEMQPENVSVSCSDKNVCLPFCQKYTKFYGAVRDCKSCGSLELSSVKVFVGRYRLVLSPTILRVISRIPGSSCP